MSDEEEAAEVLGQVIPLGAQPTDAEVQLGEWVRGLLAERSRTPHPSDAEEEP